MNKIAKTIIWGLLAAAWLSGAKAWAQADPLEQGAMSVRKLDDGLYYMEYKGDDGFAALIGNGVGTAFPGAFTAGTAQIRTDDRLAVAVLLHFSGPASAAHAQIFDRTAEAGHFMSLEVIEGDDDIRVIQGTADISLFAVFTAGNGNGDVIGFLQAIADDDIAACGDAVEAVDFRVVQMIHGVLPAAGIEGIAVREERFSAKLFDQVSDCFDIVGPEIGKIAQLSEVHFDGNKLFREIDLIDSGPAAQPLQLG